jgi:hypothetical protein
VIVCSGFIHGEVDIRRHGFFGVLSSRSLLFRYPIAHLSTRLNTLRKRLLSNIIDDISMSMYPVTTPNVRQ